MEYRRASRKQQTEGWRRTGKFERGAREMKTKKKQGYRKPSHPCPHRAHDCQVLKGGGRKQRMPRSEEFPIVDGRVDPDLLLF